jgi:hypothetical protein
MRCAGARVTRKLSKNGLHISEQHEAHKHAQCLATSTASMDSTHIKQSAGASASWKDIPPAMRTQWVKMGSGLGLAGSRIPAADEL